MYTVNDAYLAMDLLAPFNTQEKYDNSGLIVGNKTDKVDKIMLSLDITNKVIEEAKAKKCQLIISHHPVIFNPLKNVDRENPVYKLTEYGIAAICSHTPLDMCENGMNKAFFNLLKTRVKVEKYDILEKVSDNTGFGLICDTDKSIDPDDFAGILKEIFGCTMVKYYNSGKPIKRIAFCSGAGASIIHLATDKNADAFISGDVKQDQFMTAINYGISLYDCGHFHTETIIFVYLKYYLKSKLPLVEIIEAEYNKDLLSYKF